MTSKTVFSKFSTALLLCALGLFCDRTQAWQSDNGNGTYQNPVLYADYPDPDIIRVSNDFYMVSTTFVDTPGINLLHSKDLVNWELLSHCATNLSGGNSYDMIGGTAYRGGLWAASIRHYNGTFYVAVNPTFSNGRIYYATNAAGPWQYYQLNQGIYDPGLFIDTDGKGYVVYGHGPQSIATLNASYSQVLAVSNNVVNSGGEGSHLVKRGSYYYLFNANPGVWPFQLRCARATNIFGPWETGRICLTATTGGHQGAIVDVDDSGTNWFGFVHQDNGAIGRMTRIGPVFWENDWPVFGTPAARDQMAASYPKPVPGHPIKQPATADDFSAATLGLQWQWNHNPDNSRWSLTSRPGFLRLRPTLATNFWFARNTLTQKGQGPWSRGEVKFDVSNLQPGDVCGFGTLAKTNGQIALVVDGVGNKTLNLRVIVPLDGSNTNLYQTTVATAPFAGSNLWLRTEMDFATSKGLCSYSTNGINWSGLGGPFNLAYDWASSTFQGEKYAIFCYNPNTAASTGYVDVDYFNFTDTVARGRPKLNAARTTFVADNGQLLRGPYESTEWTTAAPAAEVVKMKELGFNAVHLYAEVFDLNYPNPGSTAPGYAVAEVDKMVAITRTNGLYLIMTIGNGANNGNYNAAYVTNFWNFYAPRYANETHVIYEVQNEPVAWGPPYSSPTATPPGAVNMEVAAYNSIRAGAPHTPVLLFSYAVLGDTGGAANALTDIRAFNQAVFGSQNAVWTNIAVGFHGYAGASAFEIAVSNLLSAGYPCFQTEFGAGTWGGGPGGLDVEGVAILERLNVSWLAFAYIPPSGVSDDVTKPEVYSNRVVNAGLSWTPDFGSFPVARGVFGNNDYPRTTPNYVNNTLGGTLRIQAEDFDNGGKGVAYYNGNASNPGGQYRLSETVGIEITGDAGGGYDVGWTAAGDWLEYTIKVAQAGMYDLRLRVAGTSAGRVQFIANGTDLTGEWTLPNTGGAQTWQTGSRSIFLTPGQQKLRLNILAGGFNLNWLELSPAASGPIANGTYKILNAASGMALDLNSTNQVITTAYSGTSTQHWSFQHIGGGQYRVNSVAKGNSWYAWAGPLRLLPWGWGAGGDTCYIFRPTGNGYYRFMTAGGGTCFEPSSDTPPLLDDGIYTGATRQQWAILPPAAPQFPTGLTATPTSPTQVELTWNAVAGATSYNLKRATSNGGPYTTVASGLISTNYTDSGLVTGFSYHYVVSAMIGAAESLNSGEAIVLPPWQWQDIGATGISGSTTYSNGVFFLGGSGADIWGTIDAFRFAYVTATGNCTIVARVVDVQNTDGWAKAGVMIRSSLAANAPNAFVAVTPGNGVTWQYRATIGGNSANAATSGLSAPYWVRLVRSGNTFTGFRSANGITWTQQGTTAIAMGSTVYVGLALTSHNNSSLGAATFDNVSVPNWSTAPPPLAPTGLIATAVSSIQINAQWNAASNATSYNVKRGVAAAGPYTTIATGVAGTNYSDSALAAGTTYYYVVSAVNGAGESTNSAPTSATTLPPGLGALAHRYSFSETNGTTAADSIGGNLWDGALPNGGNFSGGQLALVATSSHYVNLPAGIVSSLSNITLMAWVNLSSNATWNRLFDFGDNTTRYMFLTPQIGGTMRFAITTNGSGAAEQQINCNAGLPIDAWHQVAVTLSATTGRGVLYLNGVAVGTNSSMTLNPASLGSTVNNYLGRSQWPDPYLNGMLDEFRIYSEALSPAEIAATYALGANQPLSTTAPQLGITTTPMAITLHWPLAAAGYTVQSRTNLSTGSWVNLASPPPQIVGSEWLVTVPTTANAPSTFYRLAK